MRIAVVGAGLSGVTVAKRLSASCEVTVFEKARGVGGRMSTRRADLFSFDHGAQFFTARAIEFQEALKPLLLDGVVKPWCGQFIEFDGAQVVRRYAWNEHQPHYVGVPSMSAVVKYFARGLDIRTNSRIIGLHRSSTWSLEDQNGIVYGPFDRVIITAPIAQTMALLPNTISFFSSGPLPVMQACYSLMLGFNEPLNLNFDAALVKNKDISWISVNSSKPGRPPAPTILVHATNRWADKHLETPSEEVLAYLLQEASDVIKLDLNHLAKHRSVHLWRYANIKKQPSSDPYWDNELGIGVCGDWCLQGRVEAAFLSGFRLAQVLQKTQG
jgi:renalase